MHNIATLHSTEIRLYFRYQACRARVLVSHSGARCVFALFTMILRASIPRILRHECRVIFKANGTIEVQHSDIVSKRDRAREVICRSETWYRASSPRRTFVRARVHRYTIEIYLQKKSKKKIEIAVTESRKKTLLNDRSELLAHGLPFVSGMHMYILY